MKLRKVVESQHNKAYLDNHLPTASSLMLILHEIDASIADSEVKQLNQLVEHPRSSAYWQEQHGLAVEALKAAQQKNEDLQERLNRALEQLHELT